MSAAGLNAILKRMTKLTQQVQSAPKSERATALFDLGVEADGLASLMNREVEAHGMQERELLDLALSRTKELGVADPVQQAEEELLLRRFSVHAVPGRGASGAACGRAPSSSCCRISSINPRARTQPRSRPRQRRSSGSSRSIRPSKAMPRCGSTWLSTTGTSITCTGTRTTRPAWNGSTSGRASELQRIVKLYPGTEQADAARQQLQKLDEERQQELAPRNLVTMTVG